MRHRISATGTTGSSLRPSAAYRCLRSICELAARREGEDAAVLTRALVAVTLRYLWLAVVDEKNERTDCFRRLLRRGANDLATAGDTEPHPRSLTTDLSSAIAGYPANPGDPGELSLERADDQQAGEMLGLAVVTFAALLDFSEPIIGHDGLGVEVAEMIRAYHLDTG